MITGLPAYILGSVQIFVEDLWARLATFNAFIEGYFGAPGKWAFWILASTMLLLLVGKATKLTFNIMRYVLLPSAAHCRRPGRIVALSQADLGNRL